MNRAFPAFVLIAGAVVLGAALLSQHWGGLAPCELCLYERWPWDAAVVIALLALVVGSEAGLPWVALALSLVFVLGTGVAFYHVGVEQHWFAGPTACTAPAKAAQTLDELRAQLMHAQPVRCDEPAWTLWGVSLAGWNFLASFSMAMISFAAAYLARGRRRREA
ncbi:MAG TPA: disulfide bond formation protein B [Stellaceae bacterium]|nr:disulfide bond formation protein B [Stellaceae bacterium]